MCFAWRLLIVRWTTLWLLQSRDNLQEQRHLLSFGPSWRPYVHVSVYVVAGTTISSWRSRPSRLTVYNGPVKIICFYVLHWAPIRGVGAKITVKENYKERPRHKFQLKKYRHVFDDNELQKSRSVVSSIELELEWRACEVRSASNTPSRKWVWKSQQLRPNYTDDLPLKHSSLVMMSWSTAIAPSVTPWKLCASNSI